MNHSKWAMASPWYTSVFVGQTTHFNCPFPSSIYAPQVCMGSLSQEWKVFLRMWTLFSQWNTLEFNVQLHNMSRARGPSTTGPCPNLEPIRHNAGPPPPPLFGFEEDRPTDLGHGMVNIIGSQKYLWLLLSALHIMANYVTYSLWRGQFCLCGRNELSHKTPKTWRLVRKYRLSELASVIYLCSWRDSLIRYFLIQCGTLL